MSKKAPAPPPAAPLPPPVQFEKQVQYRGPGAKTTGGAPAGGGAGAAVPTTGSLMSPVGSVINSLFNGGKKPGTF